MSLGRRRLLHAVNVLVQLSLVGMVVSCSTVRENPAMCKVTTALVGGTLGAATAAPIMAHSNSDGGAIFAAAAGGFLGGVLLGIIASPAVCPTGPVSPATPTPTTPGP